jgi:membrane dipeptidase
VIVDGHNDLVLRTWRGEQPQHLVLASAREVGFAGGFFALYVPNAEPMREPRRTPYDLALTPAVPRDVAAPVAADLATVLERLDVTIAKRVEDFAPGRVAAIMHLEGAEPLAPDLSDLHGWYERGLRSIGIVWSRPNAFGEGVPFRFPGSPSTGAGLT